jgi:hypothetical protein
MKSASTPPRLILPGQPDNATAAPTSGEPHGVLWDKAAPDGPPQPVVRQYPDWFQSIHAFITAAVADEGVVMDLAIEKAVEVVKFNHDRGACGIDLFPKAEGGSALGRSELVMLSLPIAIELYKETVKSLAGDRKDEFKAVVEKALAARDAPAGT